MADTAVIAENRKSTLKIGKKAFFSAVFILLTLMVIAGILTRIVPPGEYERVFENGRELVVPGSYKETSHSAAQIDLSSQPPCVNLSGIAHNIYKENKVFIVE